MGLIDRTDESSNRNTRVGGYLRLARDVAEVRPGERWDDAEVFTPAPPTYRQSWSPLSRVAAALLRAVAVGRVELVIRCESDMLVDGAPCCDQFMAHELARAGLVRPSRPGLVGHRVPAVLTDAGRAALDATPSIA